MVTTARWDKPPPDPHRTGGIGVEDREGFGDDIAREVDPPWPPPRKSFRGRCARGLTLSDQTVARLLRRANAPFLVGGEQSRWRQAGQPRRRIFTARFAGVVSLIGGASARLESCGDALVADWASSGTRGAGGPSGASTRLAIVGGRTWESHP